MSKNPSVMEEYETYLGDPKTVDDFLKILNALKKQGKGDVDVSIHGLDSQDMWLLEYPGDPECIVIND